MLTAARFLFLELLSSPHISVFWYHLVHRACVCLGVFCSNRHLFSSAPRRSLLPISYSESSWMSVRVSRRATLAHLPIPSAFNKVVQIAFNSRTTCSRLSLHHVCFAAGVPGSALSVGTHVVVARTCSDDKANTQRAAGAKTWSTLQTQNCASRTYSGGDPSVCAQNLRPRRTANTRVGSPCWQQIWRGDFSHVGYHSDFLWWSWRKKRETNT